MSKKPINIIFADDHQSLRTSMIKVLEVEGIHSIGEAKDGKELLKLLESKTPDVVLLDLDMEVMNGLEAFKIIKVKHPLVKVIIFTNYSEGALQNKFKKMGANSYLVKSMSIETVVQTIRKVHIANSYNNIRNKPESKFTRREIEVIPLLIAGKTSKEIATLLFISPRTVEATRNRLYLKTDSKNASEFAATCGIMGLGFLADSFKTETRFQFGPNGTIKVQ